MRDYCTQCGMNRSSIFPSMMRALHGKNSALTIGGEPMTNCSECHIILEETNKNLRDINTKINDLFFENIPYSISELKNRENHIDYRLILESLYHELLKSDPKGEYYCCYACLDMTHKYEYAWYITYLVRAKYHLDKGQYAEACLEFKILFLQDVGEKIFNEIKNLLKEHFDEDNPKNI